MTILHRNVMPQYPQNKQRSLRLSTDAPQQIALPRGPSRRSALLALVLVAFAAVLNGGCSGVPSFCGWLQHAPPPELPISSGPTFQTFASPMYQSNRPRRVVMLESGPTPGTFGESKKLIAEIASQIRASGTFEVVVPHNERLHVHPDNILNGQYDEREIVEISRRYNADAIALVRVNELRSFSPMRLSATMAIIDSNESVVIFGIDGTWDTALRGTQNEFRDFANARGNIGPDSSPTIYLQSPTLLMSYVASQISGALTGR